MQRTVARAKSFYFNSAAVNSCIFVYYVQMHTFIIGFGFIRFLDAIEQRQWQTYIKCIILVHIAERTCMTQCFHSHVNWIEINKWRVRVCFAVGRPEAMANQNEWSRFQKQCTPKHVYINTVWILFYDSIYHFDHVCVFKICGQRSRARMNRIFIADLRLLALACITFILSLYADVPYPHCSTVENDASDPRPFR